MTTFRNEESPTIRKQLVEEFILHLLVIHSQEH